MSSSRTPHGHSEGGDEKIISATPIIDPVNLPRSPRGIIFPEGVSPEKATRAKLITSPSAEEIATHAHAESPDVNWENFFGMTKEGIAYHLAHDMRKISDVFSRTCDIPQIDAIVQAAKGLDFRDVAFAFRDTAHLDHTYHLLSRFLDTYGNLCDERFYQYVFFLVKLGHYGDDDVGIVASDEFVEYAARSLATVPRESKKFWHAYDTSNLLADRFSQAHARELVHTLSSASLLSGDLAQTLFDRFPRLKETIMPDSADYKNLPWQEIDANRATLALRARNEVETLCPLDTHLGIEIEMKLSGDRNEQELSPNAPIRRAIEASGLAIMGVDDYLDDYVAELRTQDGGFSLDAASAADLRRIARTLAGSPTLAAFSSTHISTDRRFLNDPIALMAFRKFLLDRMETKGVPLSFSEGGRNVLDVSGYIDQMMIVAAFCDVSRSVRSQLTLLDTLSPSGKIALLAMDQNLLASLYIELACATDKRFVIPAILRAARRGILPRLRTDLIIEDMSFAEIRPFLEDETVNKEIRTNAARSMRETPLAELKDFLMKDGRNLTIRGALVSRVSSISFHEFRDMLDAREYSVPMLWCLSRRVRETPFVEVQSFLKDSRYENFILKDIASRVIPVSFKELELFLRDDTIDRDVRAAAASRLQETPLHILLPFLIDQKLPTLIRRRVASRITPLSFTMLKPTFEDPTLSEEVRTGLAGALTETPYAELESFIHSNSTQSIAIRKAVVDRMAQLRQEREERTMHASRGV